MLALLCVLSLYLITYENVQSAHETTVTLMDLHGASQNPDSMPDNWLVQEPSFRKGLRFVRRRLGGLMRAGLDPEAPQSQVIVAEFYVVRDKPGKDLTPKDIQVEGLMGDRVVLTATAREMSGNDQEGLYVIQATMPNLHLPFDRVRLSIGDQHYVFMR